MAARPPQGEEVDLDNICVFPPREEIVGTLTRLVPLREEHADGLLDTIAGEANSSLYSYMGYGPFSDTDSFRAHIKHYANTKDPLFFGIIDNKTGQLVGHISFLRIDVPNRVVEIGHVLFAPSLQRTTQATELFYLMAKKAFECGYRRLEWKCNALNAASRRAALRFGHTFEGVFRQHMIVKGRNRDSAWFSILDSEWPYRKLAFQSWLHPSNFDSEGKQITDLKYFQEVYSKSDGSSG